MANFSISGKLTVGGATTLSSLTASRVLITDASKNIAVSAVTSTELGYLDGVTSNIQSQINSKSSVGKDTKGMNWNKDDVSYTGKSSAEIFNDYTNNIASGLYSHAEGKYTTASGEASHAEGYGTTASGRYSHAEGKDTTASGPWQHVQGKYNVEDTAGTYVHIVGWGSSTSARKNIHTIDTSGNAVFAGKVTVQNTTPTAAGDLATKSYVDSKASASDTKVTNTLNNTVQAYVTGTTSATTNTGTQVFDSGVYLTTESGTLHVSKIEVGGSALSFDNDLQMLSISFA